MVGAMPQITIELDQDTVDALAARKDSAAPSTEEVARRALYQIAYLPDDKASYRKPCTCGHLERMADNPEFPVHFDKRTNEYWITHDPGRYSLIVRYCFFCGDAAPMSKRASLFAYVPETEKSRLAKLCEGIESFEDAMDRLGPPDFDVAGGMMVPASNGDERDKSVVLRTMTYRQLSDTAEVLFVQKPDSSGVSLMIYAKPLEGTSTLT